MKVKTLSILLLLLATPLVLAAGEGADTSAILAPINKIAQLVKDVVNVIAVLAFIVAGAMFLFSGNNPQARENAKGMLTHAVIGLIVINVAPLLYTYITTL